MNSNPDPWQLLVAAARKAPSHPADDAPPHGFATRVLARRRALEHAEGIPGLVPLLRRALAFSVLAAALAIAATYPGTDNPGTDEVEMADSAITLLLAP